MNRASSLFAKSLPQVPALGLWVAVLCIALAFLFPLGMGLSLNDWWYRLTTLALMGISWNLMAGAGLLSLGHAAFWGVGAYAAIIVSNALGAPFWVALLFSMAAGTVLGSSIALITGRLRGVYFAVGTLAMSEGLRVLALMLPDLAGGGEGIYLGTQYFPGQSVVIGAAFGGSVIAFLISYLLSRSPYQFALRAMRNNEDSAMMVGVNPLSIRVAITALSGAIASFAGGISAFHSGFLDPRIAFDLHHTIMAKFAPVLGGVYTVIGPVLGTLLTNIISDLTRIIFGTTQGLSLFLFGMLIMLVILFMPQGMVGIWKRVMARRAATEPAPALKIAETLSK